MHLISLTFSHSIIFYSENPISKFRASALEKSIFGFAKAVADPDPGSASLLRDFDFNADPDTAFHSNADPDLASQKTLQ
jgi:hypothetical protein